MFELFLNFCGSSQKNLDLFFKVGLEIITGKDVEGIRHGDPDFGPVPLEGQEAVFFDQLFRKGTNQIPIDMFVFERDCGDAQMFANEFEQLPLGDKPFLDEDVAQIFAQIFFADTGDGQLILRDETVLHQLLGKTARQIDRTQRSLVGHM